MYDEHADRLYTAEELDEILANEEGQGGKPKKRRRRR